MSDNSAIEWTDATWNPVRARLIADPDKVGWHCTHKSEGCRNCYAEAFNRRLGTGLDYKPGHEKLIEIFLDEKALLKPLSWRRPRMIFVGSMTDLFADFVSDAAIVRMFEVMGACPQHTFQVLTKRPDRMRAIVTGLSACGEHWPPSGDYLPQVPLPNVWLGTSVEDQAAADERIPHLLATPAAVRFLSCEPLLGPVDLAPWWKENVPASTYWHPNGLHWVICGGESGAKARPMHPDWARSLRGQCAETRVPFFFKQWGAWGETWSPDRDGATHFVDRSGQLIELVSGMNWPKGGVPMRRMRKDRAGRLLDGVTHDRMPEAMA